MKIEFIFDKGKLKKESLKELMMIGMPLDLLQDFHIQVGF